MLKILSFFFELSRFSNLKDSTTLEELESINSGLCGMQASWFIKKCKDAGFMATHMTLPHTPAGSKFTLQDGNGHSLATVNMYGKWIMFDCSNGIVFLTEDNTSLSTWPELFSFVKKYNELPNHIQLSKTFYSNPSSDPIPSTIPIESCIKCNTVGIFNRYYNVDNILANENYFFFDLNNNKWYAVDSKTNEYIYSLEPKTINKT